MSLVSSAAFAAAFRALGGRPLGRVLRGCWRLGVWLVVALASLSLLAWLTLHWGILPRLDVLRPRLEAVVGQRLGVEVKIGRLEARSSGWVPAFTLHEVLLKDPQGREALRLPQVQAALSVPSLLSLRPRFAQLLIDGARLEVRRTRAGHWLVAGLDMAGGPALGSEEAADWLFEQGEFVIRGGQLRWVDEQRGAPPLALHDVQLVLRNQGRRHLLRLDATPPPDWGARFQLIVQARHPLLTHSGPGVGLGRAGDWSQWSGQLYAELPRADAAQLRRHIDLPVDLQQGRAALRAWLEWDKLSPRRLTLDAQLQQVQLRLAPGLAPLDLQDGGLRLEARREAQDVQIQLRDLHFSLPDGRRWAPSQLAVQGRWAPPQGPAQAASGPAPAASGPAPASEPAPVITTAAASAPEAARPHLSPLYWTWPSAGGTLQADRLDLALLAQLAERLPLGAGLRRLLAQLQPQGQVQGLQARWQGPLDAPETWQVQAQVRGMAMASADSPEPHGIGRPGWRGADLDIQATQAGGRAGLTLDGGALRFPGVFEQPEVALKRFSAQLEWQIQAQAEGPPRVNLSVSRARFANDDAEGQLEARWHTGPGTGFGKGGRLPGVLSLKGELGRGRATAVARYLPLGIPEDTRHWVQHAVLAGEVRQVGFEVQGDLWDFPFVNRDEGVFRIAGQVDDATLAYVPSWPASASAPAWASPWPAFSQVSGELVFERDTMHFRQARGRLWGVALSEVQGRIRDLSPHAVLEIEGRAQGPAADLLRYVRSTPLNDWTEHALAEAAIGGAAELKLALKLPLHQVESGSVQGELQLAGNDVLLRPGLPLLAQARGQVDFTQRGLQLRGVRSQVMGGEVQIDGGVLPDGRQRYQVAGTATAEALRRQTEWPRLAQAAQRWSGQAAYRLQLGLVNGQTELLLSSGLQGLGIDLPAPLGKPATEARPLRLQTQVLPTPAGGRWPRDLVRLELGPLQASLLRELGPGDPLLLRSAYAYGAPLPEPVAGGRAVLKLPALDIDPWRALLASATEGAPADPAAAFDTWWPQQLQLETAELKGLGRRLTGVTLDVQHQPGPAEASWQVQVQADQTQGTLGYREPRPGLDNGRLQARLSRLALPPGEAEQVSALLDDAPASVPALDIQIEQFELRGKPLGRLLVQASNRPPAGAAASGFGTARSEWQLSQLQLSNPDARLQASGRWLPARPSLGAGAVVGASRRLALDFTLDVEDGGRLLERLGFGRVVRGSRGSLSGHLGWDGSPLALHLPSLAGEVKVQFKNGQFLKADAGAARLLGVLSLQALPRRLALDFRDLFQEGFAFDDVLGDVHIEQGSASTDNLRMRGLQAAVLLAGSADIARETQDLTVLVLPELNTATASLAYAAINPAVGLGAFLGQWLLREPLRLASAREFRLTGTWDDPQVKRVERRLTDPLPPHASLPSGTSAASGQAAADAAARAASAADASPLRPRP